METSIKWSLLIAALAGAKWQREENRQLDNDRQSLAQLPATYERAL